MRTSESARIYMHRWQRGKRDWLARFSLLGRCVVRPVCTGTTIPRFKECKGSFCSSFRVDERRGGQIRPRLFFFTCFGVRRDGFARRLRYSMSPTWNVLGVFLGGLGLATWGNQARRSGPNIYLTGFLV